MPRKHSVSFKDQKLHPHHIYQLGVILYSVYCLKLRSKIKANERISPLKRPIGHWVLLGITIVMIHLQPIDLERIYGIDIAFIILSLFLADSYWDFKKLKLFNK